MARIQVPMPLTGTIILPTTADYDAAKAWLDAAPAAARLAGGIASYVGTRNQRRIVFTFVNQITDFNTVIPLAPPLP